MEEEDASTARIFLLILLTGQIHSMHYFVTMSTARTSMMRGNVWKSLAPVLMHVRVRRKVEPQHCGTQPVMQIRYGVLICCLLF